MWRSFVFSFCVLVVIGDALAQPVRRSNLDVTATVVSVTTSKRLTVRDSGGRVFQIDASKDVASKIKTGDTVRVTGVTIDGKRIAAANVAFVRAATPAVPLRRTMIRSLTLSKTSICPGEEISVNVTAQHPTVTGGWLNVMINGYAGNRRILRFAGRPGQRYISVAVSTDDGITETQNRTITVRDCAAVPFNDVRTRFNPYHPYTVDFLIGNHEPPARRYQWDFGDGTPVLTTEAPFVSHDYAKSIGDAKRYYTFETTVRDMRTNLLTRNFVTVHSPEFRDKQRDLIQPRVTTSGRLEEHGRRYSGSFRIENVSTEALLFDRAIIEYQYCDPTRPSTYATTTPADVIFHGGRDDVPPPTITVQPRTGVTPASPATPATGTSTTLTPPTITPTSPASPTVTTQPATGTTVTTPTTGTRPVTPTRPSTPIVVTIGTTPSISPTGNVVIVPTTSIAAKQTHNGFLRVLSIPDDVCGIAYHLVGKTPAGADVFASLYYEVRSNPFLTTQVTDARMRTFLRQLGDRGLVADPEAIDQETLYRLKQEGKIRETSSGWEIVQ